MARGVKGGHPQRSQTNLPVQHVGDPFLHLAGRFVGEGDGQNAFRPDTVVFQQARDAMGDDARLPAARAGEDQQWRAAMQHRLLLLRIQPVQGHVGLLYRGSATHKWEEWEVWEEWELF